VRRFDYLLKQTELFSHFMGNTKATSPLKIKDKRTKKSAGGKEGDHRHRMTEQEEDEELLSDLNQAKKIAVSFDESPAYIKVGTVPYTVVVSCVPDLDLNLLVTLMRIRILLVTLTRIRIIPFNLMRIQAKLFMNADRRRNFRKSFLVYNIALEKTLGIYSPN
jgi:hypothetical protein